MEYQILWFLPWCWVVNMSFDLLVWSGRTYPWVGIRNTPIDNYRVLSDGYRLLGDSTTWLGLLQAGLLGALGEIFFHGHLFLLLAILVWCGHALGSFLKRRMGMPRGAFLPGVDHADYVIVAGGIFVLLDRLSFGALLVSIIVTLLITPLVTVIGHAVHIRARPI